MIPHESFLLEYSKVIRKASGPNIWEQLSSWFWLQEGVSSYSTGEADSLININDMIRVVTNLYIGTKNLSINIVTKNY